MPDYSKMSSDDFYNILLDILQDESRETILAIPGVYEHVAEHYNNEVLDLWESRSKVFKVWRWHECLAGTFLDLEEAREHEKTLLNTGYPEAHTTDYKGNVVDEDYEDE